MGKVFGMVASFVGAGALSGPAVAGFLLEFTGYWATWSIVIVVLSLDIVMRLAMVEKPRNHGKAADTEDEESSDQNAKPDGGVTEDSALLADTSPKSYSSPERNVDVNQNNRPSIFDFYRAILCQPRVVVGLLSYMMHSSLLASYNTTIPAHVSHAFDWDALATGLLFVALQSPSLVLSPLCGWLRDKIGTRVPAGMGFVLIAPSLWLVGQRIRSSSHGVALWIRPRLYTLSRSSALDVSRIC
jgi:MFS family permease